MKSLFVSFLDENQADWEMKNRRISKFREVNKLLKIRSEIEIYKSWKSRENSVEKFVSIKSQIDRCRFRTSNKMTDLENKTKAFEFLLKSSSRKISNFPKMNFFPNKTFNWKYFLIGRSFRWSETEDVREVNESVEIENDGGSEAKELLRIFTLSVVFSKLYLQSVVKNGNTDVLSALLCLSLFLFLEPIESAWSIQTETFLFVLDLKTNSKTNDGR